MKKIASLIAFAAALAGTWYLVNTTPAVEFETHVGIQDKLSELIKETIAAKGPQMKDITVTKIWTENLGENKVRATFTYQFTEVNPETNEETQQTIDGEAELYREVSEDSGANKWVLQAVKTTNDAVQFTEGSVITSGPESSESSAEAVTPTAATAPVQSPSATTPDTTKPETTPAKKTTPAASTSVTPPPSSASPKTN